MGYYSKQHSVAIIANQTLQSTGGSTAYSSNGVGTKHSRSGSPPTSAGGVWVKIEALPPLMPREPIAVPMSRGQYFQLYSRNDALAQWLKPPRPASSILPKWLERCRS